MSVKLNIGLSRKVGESNYGSRGASINLEVELDNGVLNDPGQLRDRVSDLYALARQSVDEELQRPADAGPNEPSHENGNGHARTNGHANGNGHSNGQHNRVEVAGATQSQIRLTTAIRDWRSSPSKRWKSNANRMIALPISPRPWSGKAANSWKLRKNWSNTTPRLVGKSK